MANTYDQFDQRLRNINRKHQVLARGYTSVVGRDGLIIVKPKRVKRSIPVKGLTLLMLGFFGFKGLMLAHLGEAAYDSRLADLRDGTIVEMSGAYVMQADPLTQWMAKQARPFLF